MSSTSLSTARLVSRPGQQTAAAATPAGPSREARRLAAVILEVMGGARTPTQAAEALGLSLIRYYQLETRAMQGLVAACEPKPKGRVVSAQSRLATMEKEKQRLVRELARQQALVRLSQRAVGLAPPPPSKTPGKGKKPRRPTARALKMAEQLQAEDNDNAAGTGPCPLAGEAK